jgi:hypothetical protein
LIVDSPTHKSAATTSSAEVIEISDDDKPAVKLEKSGNIYNVF